MNANAMAYLRSLLIYFGLLGPVLGLAQLSFKDANHLLSPDEFYFSTNPVGVADMNGDGYDDVVRLLEGKTLYIEYQEPGTGVLNSTRVDFIHPASEWSLSIGDVDNNGHNDLLIAGLNNQPKLLLADALGENYSKSLLPGPTLFTQGSNFADINNDGFLDAFACHDLGQNRIWGNDGTGTLLEADQWLNMPPHAGNYGSVWADFDNDGDLDLYITKCSEASSGPNDPRQINLLFVNNGNGQYTEAAATYNLRITRQSWTSDFQDIDNDGDLDVFITNHDTDSQILENNGQGHFTDISASAGMGELIFPLQGILRDFDNDTYVDILVAGDETRFFRNNGDRTFSLVESLFGSRSFASCAIGDLNHDGFLDIYASYSAKLNKPSAFSDILWLNEGNDNHFLAVRLQGSQSNRNGVGARITIYGDWGVQIREVRAGESYGIHNTFTQHFGLGFHEQVDSLVVRWPSGIVDRFTDIWADQFVEILEGQCISPNASLQLSGPTRFCSGDSLVISAPEGYSYQWSNGAQASAITVMESGVYAVTISNGGNCVAQPPGVWVDVDPDETPMISSLFDTINCLQEVITLSASEAPNYQWSNGASSQSIEVIGPGTYTVSTDGLCSSFISESYELYVYEVAPPKEVRGDTVAKDETARLTAEGNDLHWYDAEWGGQLLGTGPELLIPDPGMSSTYWVEDRAEFSKAPFFGGKTDKGEIGVYANSTTRSMYIQLEESLLIKSVKVYAAEAGERTIGFFNQETSEVLPSVTVMIPEGESRVVLNKVLPKSEHIRMFIHQNARLFSDTDLEYIQFPYLLRDFGKIFGSDDGRYHFFYDWEVQLADPLSCGSIRLPASLEVIVSAKEIDQANGIELFPNPTNGILQLKLPAKGEGLVKVYNVQGIPVLQRFVQGSENPILDLSAQAPGLLSGGDSRRRKELLGEGGEAILKGKGGCMCCGVLVGYN